jgi:hypothetical protein
VILENLENGSTLEEIIENYRITREQIQTVLEFAAHSAAPPRPPQENPGDRTDARPVDKSTPYGLIRHLEGHSIPPQKSADGTGWGTALLTAAEQAGIEVFLRSSLRCVEAATPGNEPPLHVSSIACV